MHAIAPGADVSDSVKRWIIWLLNDEASPVYEHVARGAAEQIITLYERRLAGDEPTADEWKSTRLKARAALERHRGATVTEAVCEKPGWDRYAVTVKAPYHACTVLRNGTAGAEHERTQRVDRARREHHAADGRRAERAAREGAHPGAGSIWLAGRSRRPGATTRRARGDTPENAQITVQAGTPQRSRTAGVPLLPMEHQAGVVRGAELVDEDGQTSRDGLTDDPRARHVELGDDLIKLHELTPRQAHLGGSIKRLGSGVRRRLGSGQATTATRGERQRSAQRKGAATAPTSRPIGMNDRAWQSLAEGLVNDVRHRVEVRRERARDRLDNRANKVGIRIRMLVVDGRDEVGQSGRRDDSEPTRERRADRQERHWTGLRGRRSDRRPWQPALAGQHGARAPSG